MENVIVIDGSRGEGGGQILRISAALSALLLLPIEITKIRANRPKPGLAAQHLAGLNFIAKLSNAELIGGKIQSKEIKFTPKDHSLFDDNHEKVHKQMVDTKTAGSVLLLIQVSLPFLCFRNTEIELRGGTNATMAPPYDYFETVFLPTIKKMGVNLEATLVRRGFYPKGMGIVRLKTHAIHSISPIFLEDFGELTSINIFSYYAGAITDNIPNRMTNLAYSTLKQKFPNLNIIKKIVKETREKAWGDGWGIMITATTSTGCILGSSCIGEASTTPENIGLKAANDLINDIDHECCVDEYLQDQLIIYMALAKGKSRIKTGPLSLHTTTAIEVTEKITNVQFIQTPTPNGGFFIECEGMGFSH